MSSKIFRALIKRISGEGANLPSGAYLLYI